MRGAEAPQGGLFSYVSVENRSPADHPLRVVCMLLDELLASMSRDSDPVTPRSVAAPSLWAVQASFRIPGSVRARREAIAGCG